MEQNPDYSLLDKHIELLTKLATVSNSGISVFDSHRKRHVFTSYNFSELFGYDMQRIETEDIEYFNLHIHPDDMIRLERNGKAVEEYFKLPGNTAELPRTKMINEYRILVGERYIRVIEQYQVLELFDNGEVWLSLSVLDVSPNQGPLETVQSKLMNCATGQVYQLPEFTGETRTAPLSQREKKILQLVGEGLLSKEISEQLTISVHTVNTHRQRILEKLNVDNSMEAVKYAARYGLLD